MELTPHSSGNFAAFKYQGKTYYRLKFRCYSTWYRYEPIYGNLEDLLNEGRQEIELFSILEWEYKKLTASKNNADLPTEDVLQFVMEAIMRKEEFDSKPLHQMSARNYIVKLENGVSSLVLYDDKLGHFKLADFSEKSITIYLHPGLTKKFYTRLLNSITVAFKTDVYMVDNDLRIFNTNMNVSSKTGEIFYTCNMLMASGSEFIIPIPKLSTN